MRGFWKVTSPLLVLLVLILIVAAMKEPNSSAGTSRRATTSYSPERLEQDAGMTQQMSTRPHPAMTTNTKAAAASRLVTRNMAPWFGSCR